MKAGIQDELRIEITSASGSGGTVTAELLYKHYRIAYMNIIIRPALKKAIRLLREAGIPVVMFASVKKDYDEKLERLEK